MKNISDLRRPFKRESERIYFGDNPKDEVMAAVLEMHPRHKQYIFRGSKGALRKKILQQDVRSYFNFLQGYEEDEFLNARGLGKRIKAGLKKISVQNIKKGLKQVSVANVKKELKEVGDKTKKVLKQISLKNIGEGLKKIGKVVAKAALAVPRGAFLALVRLNFRASASRFNNLNEEGLNKIMKKWDNMGGDKAALRRAIEAGKDKRSLACGKKCRAKAGKDVELPPDAQSEFLNFGDPGTASALIAAGGGVLAAMVNAIKDKSNYKSEIELARIDAEEQKAVDAEDKIDATMTPQEKALADEIVKAQADKFDVVKTIMDNPNITADEKQSALLHLKEEVVENAGLSTGKKIGIAVGIIAVLGVVYYFINKNKN